MGKLLGRLGWHGQCACCNGPRDKRQIKREEDQQWQREFAEEIAALAGETEALRESTERLAALQRTA